jgi:hypothetical protein
MSRQDIEDSLLRDWVFEAGLLRIDSRGWAFVQGKKDYGLVEAPEFGLWGILEPIRWSRVLIPINFEEYIS